MNEFDKCIVAGDYSEAYFLIATKKFVCSDSLFEEIRMCVEGVVCVTDRTFKKILVKVNS